MVEERKDKQDSIWGVFPLSPMSEPKSMVSEVAPLGTSCTHRYRTPYPSPSCARSHAFVASSVKRCEFLNGKKKALLIPSWRGGGEGNEVSLGEASYRRPGRLYCNVCVASHQKRKSGAIIDIDSNHNPTQYISANWQMKVGGDYWV
jgi:hypothetical protein